MDPSNKCQERPGYRLIIRYTITLRNGRVLRASEVGKRGFPIWIKDDTDQK